jgi:hypothetical protein
VVVSYYIEYRAILKFKIADAKQHQIGNVKDYGVIKGSLAYGIRKSNKLQIAAVKSVAGEQIRKIANGNSIIKMLFLFLKELKLFIQALSYDGNHLRNIMFLSVSIFASYESGMLFNALLLLDIINKIQTLGNVLSIFKDNAIALLSTLALFGVMLYIFAFVGFQSFRDHFDPEQQVYCNTLSECIVTTINMGLRMGGGLGDALVQQTWESEYFNIRYIYDFVFFMIITIILMNIFFGIIIDSFADKRAREAEVEEEVQGQCFICGISQSKFEIENVPWKDHIFTQHNLHGYLAFLIRVTEKDMSECNGVEKHVKTSLERGVIMFFPISRCLAVKNGEVISE